MVIPWPVTYQERRRRRRDAGVAVVVEEEDESEGVDEIRGGREDLQPFLVGGATQRRVVQPTRYEYAKRVGTYVAVWYTFNKREVWDGDWAVGRITGFETVNNFEKVKVHWYGPKTKRRKGAASHAKDGGPIYPGWGGELYKDTAAAGEEAHITSEWFAAVLCWGLKLSQKKLPAEEIARVQATVATSIRRWKAEAEQAEAGDSVGESD